MEKITNFTKDTPQNLRQFVLFTLYSEIFAFDILNIQEIIIVEKITPLPYMPPYILGVVNLRGNITGVIDLAKFLNLPYDSQPSSSERINVIITIFNKKNLGFTAHEIKGVKSFDTEKIMPAKVGIESHIKPFIEGVAKDEANNLISILSLENLLTSEELLQYEA